MLCLFQYHDKTLKAAPWILFMQMLITAEKIRHRIEEMAHEIALDYGNEPITLVGILNGSLMFMADLLRELKMPTRIGFLRASSYRGSTTRPGHLEILPGLVPDVRGRHVILLDDILDTARTLSGVVDFLRRQEPASLKVGVLLRKRGRQELPFEPDYTGFEIPDLFVIGYGLDFHDDYRQLPFIGAMDEATIQKATTPELMTEAILDAAMET
jgi:hypoxanthine phosphoribosyltransferase